MITSFGNQIILPIQVIIEKVFREKREGEVEARMGWALLLFRLPILGYSSRF